MATVPLQAGILLVVNTASLKHGKQLIKVTLVLANNQCITAVGVGVASAISMAIQTDSTAAAAATLGSGI